MRVPSLVYEESANSTTNRIAELTVESASIVVLPIRGQTFQGLHLSRVSV